MQLTFRAKLTAIVATTALAYIALIVSAMVFGQRAAEELADIRGRHLPKLELGHRLETGFDRMRRSFQDAVAASDNDALNGARVAKDELLAELAHGAAVVDKADAAALVAAVEGYHAVARDLSARLIGGETGETIVDSMKEMQDKQALALARLEKVASFDRAGLAASFEAAARTQDTAFSASVFTSLGCLALVILLSLWVSRGVLRSLGDLRTGLARFGLGDFKTPIPDTAGDEIGEVARQANRMAERLDKLGADHARRDWLKTAQAGLAQELGGELDPAEVADRALGFLARTLKAPAAALYCETGEPGTLARLGQFAGGEAARSFRSGEGLVGQAARGADIVVVDAPPPGYLRVRSGLGEGTPRSIVLVPLLHAGRVMGVIELALFEPLTADGRELLLSVREHIGVVIEVARARAAQRALLEETQRQAERLAAQEDELRRANVGLEQKAEELAAASRYKSQFLASMSHELRTPLNGIIGFAELLHDGAVPPESPQHREFLGDILTSGRHLLGLINDVLDLAKVEAGKLDFRPERTDLGRVVTEVLGILRTTAADKRVLTVSAVDPAIGDVFLDPARLKQVLYNYVSNALKFTREGGRVEIRVTPETDDAFRLEVEDTGAGIAAEDLQRLFSEFQQLAAGQQQQAGTGLGLSLTKRLVEAQGGSVGVRSTVGKGSVFHAVLPRRTDAAPARLPISPPAAPRDAPTVLVIEDNEADQRIMVDVLAGAGYAVELATTGGEALARCRAKRYAAVTLDLLLPDMSGLEVLRELRASDEHRDVPVVVVTVVAENGAVAGFAVADVLAKPMDPTTLLGVLRRAGVPPDKHGMVMVVDDDPTSLKLMSATLAQLGFQTCCERDGESALVTARRVKPSAVVLDLVMPGMGGFGFLEQFRREPDGQRVPVIVWTVKDLTPSELTRLHASAQAVVAKGQGASTAVLSELRSFLQPRRES